ncbi:MAG: PEP-CTERM sorting domain-containing protein [Gemmatimonas sp.]
MRKSLPFSLMLGAGLMLPNVASAQTCSDMTSLPAYVACSGAFGGNIGDNNNLSAELSFLSSTFGPTFTYQGQTGDAGSGPFANNPAGNTSGTLTFDNPIAGLFVVGLKASSSYSFYLYDGGVSGVSAVTFNTIGSGTNVQGSAQELSHATLYTAGEGGVSTNAVVPEPSTYMLMGAGLAGLGLASRRRRKQ